MGVLASHANLPRVPPLIHVARECLCRVFRSTYIYLPPPTSTYPSTVHGRELALVEWDVRVGVGRSGIIYDAILVSARLDGLQNQTPGNDRVVLDLPFVIPTYLPTYPPIYLPTST